MDYEREYPCSLPVFVPYHEHKAPPLRITIDTTTGGHVHGGYTEHAHQWSPDGARVNVYALSAIGKD